jgi:hypothetical protein
MEERAKQQVCNSVYRQFPELRGAHPSISSLPGDKFQLVFHGKAETADGKKINRTVRVTASDSGKILKMTTSR